MQTIRFYPAILALAACLPLMATASVAAGDELDAQRAAFREAYPQAELGVWEPGPAQEALLRNYVLWPDLRAAWLRTRLHDSDAEIGAFIARYDPLKPARELRYRFTLAQASKKNWPTFLELYREHYAQLGVARLDCLALGAEYGQLPAAARRERVATLWLTASSQVQECDAVFETAKRDGILDATLVAQRFELALEAREYGLARYLARSLPEPFKARAQSWTRASGQPQQFLDEHRASRSAPEYRAQLLSAIRQVAYNDPALANQYWLTIEPHHDFAAAERIETERHITLWLARNHHADAYPALLRLADAAVDDEVLRWRIRTGLREHRWQDVVRHVEALPAAEQQDLQWQYWHAIAMQQTNDGDARAILETIAQDRSYYGFLAADELDLDYAYQHRDLVVDEAAIERLAASPSLRRALELYEVGLDGRGRSEWDSAIAALDAQDQEQAAILAHRRGWHSRAIATAAINDQFDDLLIRYPLPYAAQFDSYAKAAGIRPSWALGIARSESLFMPDIQSSAGAIGVMQVMPATGRETAKALHLPFSGRATLTDPDSNIQIGTWFLGNMQQRFANHPVLATAAYNAGPHRVDAWLPADGALDARIWIETIPYAETRGYVRRVLMADAIFHWRIAGQTSRLSARLAPILPKTPVAAQVSAQDATSSAND